MAAAVDYFQRAVQRYGRLAARNLFRQGRRTLLTLLAIVLGVAGLIIAGGFVEDIFVQLGEGTIHSQVGHIQIYRKGFFAHGTQRPLEYLIDNPASIMAIVERFPDVSETMSRLDFSGLLNNGRTDAAALIEGVEPSKEAQVGTLHHVLEGRRLRDDDRYGIYVGEGLAKSLHLHAGDTASLVVSTSQGALNTLEFTITGIFRTYSKEYDARAARINLHAAQELLQTPGVNAIVLLLRKTDETATVTSQLRKSLALKGVEIMPWYDLSDFYTKTVDLFKRQFAFLELVILLLIVLSVLNAINLGMFERRGEFGTMRALGNSNFQVFGLIVTEGLFLGALGSVAGMLIGGMLALAISAIGIPMPPPPNAELGYVAQIRIRPLTVCTAGAIGIAASVVASLLPGRRISRMPIIDALRHNL